MPVVLSAINEWKCMSKAKKRHLSAPAATKKNFLLFRHEEPKKEQEKKQLAKERQMQQAVLDIKKKFGKNAILKGMNLEDGATAISRNGQIGGHRA